MWPAVIPRLSAMLLNVLCQLRTWQPVASQTRWEALAALLMLAHTHTQGGASDPTGSRSGSQSG